MENLMLSFEVVFPILIYLLLGFVFRRINLISDTASGALNSFVFGIALPFSLFINVYSVDIKQYLNPVFILQGVLSAVTVALLGLFIGAKFESDNTRKPVLAQAVLRSNFIIFGLSIASTLYGDTGIIYTSLLIAFTVPITNMFSIFAFEFFRDSKPSVRTIAKNIAKNPIIIAAVLAFLFYFLNIRIPEIAVSPIRSIANTASPVGLIALGASFKFSDTVKYRKQLTIGVFSKLILAPALIIPILILIGVSDVYLVTILAMLASPVAISSFSTAQILGGDDALAGQLVVFTSLFSIITIFLWIFTLSSLGFIIT